MENLYCSWLYAKHSSKHLFLSGEKEVECQWGEMNGKVRNTKSHDTTTFTLHTDHYLYMVLFWSRETNCWNFILWKQQLALNILPKRPSQLQSHRYKMWSVHVGGVTPKIETLLCTTGNLKIISQGVMWRLWRSRHYHGHVIWALPHGRCGLYTVTVRTMCNLTILQ